MRNTSILVAALCVSGAAYAASPLAFDFLITGPDELRPSLVFHDGQNTYVQPPEDVPVASISITNAKAEQYGPYLLIKGIPPSFELTRKAGKRLDVVKVVYQGKQASVVEKAADPAPVEGSSSLAVTHPEVASQSPVIANGCQGRQIKGESAFGVGFAAGNASVTPAVAQKLASAIGNPGDIETLFIVVDGSQLGQARAAALRTQVQQLGVRPERVRVDVTGSPIIGVEMRIVRATTAPCIGGMRIEAQHRGAVTVIAKDDASAVLRELANRLGMGFTAEGQPQDLSVLISEVNKPLVLVLERISKGIVGRADIVLRANEIVLRYGKGK